MSYVSLLQLAAPEAILVIAALAVLAADLLSLRDVELKYRTLILSMLACAGCLASILWMAAFPQTASVGDGMLVIDPVRQTIKTGLLVLTILTVLLSIDNPFTSHVGEYLALILLATTGMMFLISSEDILLIFISLELTSLSLYVLTAFQKESLRSAEAALKYFLFGGVSAAFTLFGLSLLYGFAESTSLSQIARAIQGPKLDPLLLLAMVMVAVGFAFKVAAAPFHLWAPDVYQGAPVPTAALIASGSKVAGFFVLARVVAAGFERAEGSAAWLAFRPGWVPLLAMMAVASMLLGNLAALAQTSVRRLLAYSAIAHAGYMLLGVISSAGQGFPALLYYALTYALTTLGAFAVVSVVQAEAGGDRLVDFAGLGRRSPVLALCMLVFMLSLAGIPPLAGFFGKFYVFAAALESSPPGMPLLWLVILALVMSAVSLYYYLLVLKQVYVASPAGPAEPIRLPPVTLAVLVSLALLVLLFGCAPALLIERLAPAGP